MTDKQFCIIYSAYYGDGIDKIGQLVQTTMNGEELKELIEFFIKELKLKKDEKRQLFIGKVSEVIGCRETIKLLKECELTFKNK